MAGDFPSVEANGDIASTPPAIPDHTLLQRIAGVSYGEVWLVRNVLGTLRAVKIVHRHSFDHDRPYEREFAGLQRYEPVSRSHEHLVDVLQVGRNDAGGCFYYVMELADVIGRTKGEGWRAKAEVPKTKFEGKEDGALRTEASPAAVAGERTLDLELRTSTIGLHPSPFYQPRTLLHDRRTRGCLPFDECVRLGLALTSALAHLHRHGLVHRDVKPSNIIFVDGVPKLADVGLVAATNEARSFVGTPGYIAPEGPGTPAADLYSLGKVLYELSTGRDRQDFPQWPVDLPAGVERSRWLEWNEVLTRACDPDPRRRYAAAEAMRADLERVERGQSVRAVGRELGLDFTATVRSAVEDALSRNVEAWKLTRLAAARTSELNRDGLTAATELAYQALAADPNCVEARMVLASTYRNLSGVRPPREVWPQLRDLASQALQVDSTAFRARYWLAWSRICHDYDWGGLRTDPAWDDLGDEPRFQALLKQVGLDEWPK